MISFSEFELSEIEETIENFKKLQSSESELDDKVSSIFEEFDKDKNGILDRRELRLFLQEVMTQLKIKIPLTNEYIDEVFKEIDTDKDFKISPVELKTYLAKFITHIYPLFLEHRDKITSE